MFYLMQNLSSNLLLPRTLNLPQRQSASHYYQTAQSHRHDTDVDVPINQSPTGSTSYILIHDSPDGKFICAFSQEVTDDGTEFLVSTYCPPNAHIPVFPIMVAL